MQKNLYYRTVFKRTNKLRAFLLEIVTVFASYPKLFLEVFIRKNFGERYFSVSAVVTVVIILILFPIIGDRLSFVLAKLLSNQGGYNGYYSPEESGFWMRYTTWYLFLIGFVFFSFRRWKEVKRNPSVFDFARFSLYSGDINPRFYTLPFLKRVPTIRMVEIIWEPALFLIAGILLKIIGQSLGTLLIVSSIFYCLSYLAAYHNGDNFVMDKIDEMILNEEMEHAFVEDQDAGKTRGVRFYARKPNSRELREKVSDSFIEDNLDEDITEAK